MTVELNRCWRALRSRLVDVVRASGDLKRNKRWVGAAAVLTVALLPRLVFLLQLDEALPTFDRPEGGDSAFYDRVAAGEPAPRRAYFHSPLYRWFLSAIYGAFGRDLFAARAVQLVLGAATAALVYWLTLRLFRRVSIALLAGLAAGLFGPALLYEGQLLVDGLIALLAVLGLHILLDGDHRPSSAAFALLGVVLAITALARAVILAWLPLLLVYVATVPAPRKRRLRYAVALTVGVALVVAPVTLRNYLVEGDFVLITANGGLNFFVGNNENANGSYTLPTGLWFRPGDPLDDFAGWKAARHALGHEPSSSELSRWWASQAWSFIASHPWRTLVLVKEKLRILVNNYEYPQLYNYYVYGEVASVLRVLPTATFIVGPGLVGLVAMWLGKHGRRRRTVALLATLYGLAFLPFFVTGRYRAAWIVMLTPFAAWAVVTAIRAFRRRRWRLALGLTLATAASVTLSLHPLRAYPTRANQHIEFARARLRDDDAAGAVHWARRATEVEPRYGEAWAWYGRALRLAGATSRAAEVLATQADNLPKAAAVHRELGAAYLQSHRPQQAITALRQCIRLAPGDAEAWLLLGDAMQQLSCWQRALDTYDAVETFGRDSPPARTAKRRRTELERLLATGQLPAEANEATCRQ